MARKKDNDESALELAMRLDSLPDYWPLTTRQVGAILDRSVDQLEEDRRTGRGPEWSKPFGSNGSVRYPAGKVREFLKGQPLFSTVHQARIALDDVAARLMSFDQLRTTGERLEDLAGLGGARVPLSSVVSVLGEQGRWAVQNARDALRRGLPDLRSRKIGGVRHVPLDTMAQWLSGLDGIATGEPGPMVPVSSLRAQRLRYVGRAHTNLLDEALAGWLRADQAREAADLRSLADTANAEPLPSRGGRRTP